MTLENFMASLQGFLEGNNCALSLDKIAIIKKKMDEVIIQDIPSIPHHVGPWISYQIIK